MKDNENKNEILTKSDQHFCSVRFNKRIIGLIER
jgi:hypothetical protein